MGCACSFEVSVAMTMNDNDHNNNEEATTAAKSFNFRLGKNAENAGPKTDGSELGVVNPNFHSEYKPDHIGFQSVGTPEELELKLADVGYHSLPFYAVQISLMLNTNVNSVKCILLEGPSGCGKSFMAKSLAKITGAELMCLSCFKGMNLQHLLEIPSTLGMVNAMAGKAITNTEELMNLGVSCLSD